METHGSVSLAVSQVKMVQQAEEYWNLSSFNTTVAIVEPLNVQTDGKLLK